MRSTRQCLSFDPALARGPRTDARRNARVATFDLSFALVVALVVALGLTWTATATAQPSAWWATQTQPVIYGDDDRVDVADHPNEAIRRLAIESTVTLVPKAAVTFGAGGSVTLRGRSLSEAMGVCQSARFADQPTAGFCSGSLIGPDLVLTAGHCIQPSGSSCSNTMFVFNYTYHQGSVAALNQDDVYSCRSVIAHQNASLDFAIVQLDRPVSARQTPANVRPGNGAVAEGTRVLMIGSPSGLPVKIDDGGRVRSSRTGTLDYFVATTDSFGGNSGSAVYDLNTLEIVGILTSGEQDYETVGGCLQPKFCSETGCSGENSHYAFRAVEQFCQRGTDQVLCGTNSVCGDGYCAYDETTASCPQDCSDPVCGDDICDAGEWESCPQDCELTIPSTWTCPDAYYGTSDGCDCDCGAYDPDCDLTGGSSPDCGLFGSCGSDGTCSGGLFSGDDDTFCASATGSHYAVAATWAFGFAMIAALVARRRPRAAHHV